MDKANTNEGSAPSAFALVGPTASGKTELSLRVGQVLPVEIINLDAMQIYRDMDIGTAKPSEAERALLPHHLFDICDPNTQLGAGNYAARATTVVSDILNRGRIPLFVGGTGFYLRVLRQGLSPIPEISPQIRQGLQSDLASLGLPALRAQLETNDPSWAEKIHPNDTQRTLRGLEVFRGTGKTLSEFHALPRDGALPFPLGVFVLDPHKDELQARIDSRVPSMLENGLIEEVKSLLNNGLSMDAHSMGAPGYKEVCQLIRGELPEENLVQNIRRAHRSYAKRQRTFLATEKDTTKIDTAEDLLSHISQGQTPG